MSRHLGILGGGAKGSCHMVLRSPLRYAIKKRGSRVKGTRYSRAGWAALKNWRWKGYWFKLAKDI